MRIVDVYPTIQKPNHPVLQTTVRLSERRATLRELWRIARDNEPTETQENRISSAYLAIGKHLEQSKEFNDWDLLRFDPQGSRAIGTTTKPTHDPSIDLDATLTLPKEAESHYRHLSAIRNVTPAELLLQDLQNSLSLYADAHGLEIERKKRCVRLIYVDGFHVDVVPTIERPLLGAIRYGQLAAVVPDRERKRMLETNPRGYAKSFSDISKRTPQFTTPLVKSLMVEARSDIAPLPDSDVIYDNLLARLVQLVKLHRNEYFRGRDSAPTSIFLTTMLMNTYETLCDGYVEDELVLIQKLVQCLAHGFERRSDNGSEVWHLANPTTYNENLASRMNEGARQAAYQPWLTKLNVDVAKLTMLHGSNEGVDKRKAELAHMFGESTAQRFHERVLAETTRQRKSSSILIPSAAGTFVATHAKATTMYGA